MIRRTKNWQYYHKGAKNSIIQFLFLEAFRKIYLWLSLRGTRFWILIRDSQSKIWKRCMNHLKTLTMVSMETKAVSGDLDNLSEKALLKWILRRVTGVLPAQCATWCLEHKRSLVGIAFKVAPSFWFLKMILPNCDTPTHMAAQLPTNPQPTLTHTETHTHGRTHAQNYPGTASALHTLAAQEFWQAYFHFGMVVFK